MTDSSNPISPQTPCTHAEPPDLSVFNAGYRAAKPLDNGEIPDGRYTVRIGNVQLDYSRNGDPMIKWDLVVLSGPYANRHVFKNAVITVAALPYVKGDVEMLGLKLEPFDELARRLDELVGLTLEISKRTKDDYTNVYFKKLIQAPAPEVSAPDDIPF